MDSQPASVADTHTQQPKAPSARALALYLVQAPLRFFHTALALMSRPSTFSRNHIASTTAATAKAFDFYVTAVAMAFLVGTLGSAFLVATGQTEWRELAKLLIQIALVFVPLHLLLSLAIKDIMWAKTLQAIFYADGLFLVFAAVFGVSLGAAFQFMFPDQIYAENFFSTAYEKCYADQSWLYWLMRGDLKFQYGGSYLNSSTWVGWLAQNGNYVVVPPFLVLFGRLCAPRQLGRSALAMLLGLIAFAATVEFVGRAFEAIEYRLARATHCDTTVPQSLVNNYSRKLLLSKLDEALPHELRLSFGDGSVMSQPQRAGAGYVISLKGTADRMPGRTYKSFNAASDHLEGLYCSPLPVFAVLRQLAIPLAVHVINASREPVFFRRASPRSCLDPVSKRMDFAPLYFQ